MRGLALIETALRPQISPAARQGMLEALDHDYLGLLRAAYTSFGKDSVQGASLFPRGRGTRLGDGEAVDPARAHRRPVVTCLGSRDAGDSRCSPRAAGRRASAAEDVPRARLRRDAAARADAARQLRPLRHCSIDRSIWRARSTASPPIPKGAAGGTIATSSRAGVPLVSKRGPRRLDGHARARARRSARSRSRSARATWFPRADARPRTPLQIRQILLARHQRAATDARAGRVVRIRDPRSQLAQDEARNPVLLGGKDEREQDEVGVEHAPVGAEALEQPSPVEIAGADQVEDVGAVEALALHDEGLGPDHLLGRDQHHLPVEDRARRGVLEPRRRSTVAMPLPELKMMSTWRPWW